MIDRQKIVTLATKGIYTGKPRPWVIIQSNDFLETDSVTVCLITGELIDGVPMLRIDVSPSENNGFCNRASVVKHRKRGQERVFEAL